MKKKILIYNSGGGIGDSVQLLPLILSLNSSIDSSEIYYLGAHDFHFNGKLKEYKIKIKHLDIGIQYFGFRWWHLIKARKMFSSLGIKKFDLIIDLQSKIRNTLILKTLPADNFYSTTYNFLFCSKRTNYTFENDLTQNTLNNIGKILNIEIKKKDYDINQIDKIYFTEAERLLPKNNYIGFSITQGNIYRKKTWPLINFINLAKILIKKNKIPVFFIEKNYVQIIEQIKKEVPLALFPEQNTKYACPALVTAMATRLEKSISIDNGIMHILSLVNKPMIVLFGPTNSEKFAPKNNLVKILDSKKMYNTKDITKITINDVSKYF